MHQSAKLDAWLWVLISIALLATRAYPSFGPVLTHDSFQYLFAAKGVLAGHAGYTSLIHYDVERSFGAMPAPLLTFPIGYPLAIALVTLVGVSVQTAALILSVASTVACIPLLAWIGSRLELSRAVLNVVLASFVLNGVVNEYGLEAMTESLFTFLVLFGSAMLVHRGRRGPDVRWPPFVAAGLAFGAAYFVRYAGLFFIVGLVLLTVRHAIARERSLVKGHLVAIGVAAMFVLVGIARNMHFVGNWRGRDEMLVSPSASLVLAQTAGAVNALFLGIGTSTDAVGGTFVPKIVLCLSLAFGVSSLAWARRAERSMTVDPSPMRNAMGIDLLLLAATYAGCMLYAGLTSSISYGNSRVFVPLVPLILLLFGLLLRNLLPTSGGGSGVRRLPVAILAIGFCCYAYLNMLVIRKPLTDRTAVVNERLSNGGKALRDAILSRVGPHGVILANNGQAVGYALDVPTISMVGRTFSDAEWDEKTVGDVVNRFHVTALVISSHIPGEPEVDDIPSPFVGQLAQGNAPAWLKLEYRTGDMLIYVPLRSGAPGPTPSP